MRTIDLYLDGASLPNITHAAKDPDIAGFTTNPSLYRRSLFERVSQPWFETNKHDTQDLFFCRKAKKEVGARFGVHCGVQVPHIDIATGRTF